MRLKLLTLALLAMLCSAMLTHAAQTDMPQFCANESGTYYRANLFPHYTGTNYRLSLDDWSTGEEVVVLAESLPYSFRFEWSPDCRYLVGNAEGRGDCSPGIIVWDAVSGEQNLAVDEFCERSVSDSYPHIFWRTDGSAVLFSQWYSSNSHGSRGRRFIWYPETNQRVDLGSTGRANANLHQIYWDDSRNWLWSSGNGGVVAFDRLTGSMMVDFRNARQGVGTTSSYFAFSPDNNKVIIYGHYDQFLQEAEAMTVYDIASGVGTQVNVERNGAGVVALSPDNRYLVMGYTALRVWDLQNLPVDVEARLPINRINTGGERISAVCFLDNITVEVDSTEISSWNILTGERIS